MTHAWIDVVDPESGAVKPGAMDEPATALERFRVYHVRFQVLNDSSEPASMTPVLEYGPGKTPALFVTVPDGGPARDRAFYTSAPAGPGDDVRVDPIRAVDLRLAGSSDVTPATAIDGLQSAGASLLQPIAMPPHTYTEVDFAIRATADAAWDKSYTFRLAQRGGDPLLEAATARVTMGAKPVIALSPGQRRGIVVDDPVPLYELRQPDPSALLTAPTAMVGPLGPAGFTSPHLEFGLTGDSCAACHSAHTAQGPMLLAQGTPESNLCFTCHDGSGADADIKGEYTDPTVPANDPATASWYSHPATTPSDHVSDREDEFGGRLDRHAACADCHQPHLSDATAPTQTTAGWSASGATAGASGVSVVNGAAGATPTFTWNETSTLEYQLCFKCHSGFTVLPANDPAHPSRWALDKAVELNPANASYHPIEAAGTNATTAMTNSLAGTSPYKLWTFQTDSTIRCVNCHGDPSLSTPASPPGADAQLSPHAGPNRGLLMQPYRDRVLKPQGERYAATDFALCYQCHAESPMVDYSGDPNAATDFRYHGAHLNLAFLYGAGGTDIDTDGAGQGNLVCAECHFRIHGSSEAVDGQPDNPRLVNFAPNAQPLDGQLSWTKTPTGGSCTLVCHGVTHRDWSY